jgi:heat shock protein HtpX
MTAAWNVIKAWLVAIGVSAALGALGYVIGGFHFGWVFAFAGLLLVLGTFWIADHAVMGMLGARELPEGEDPDLHAKVAGIAGRAQVVKPRIYLLDKGPPLALAGGRGVWSSSLAVTTSLLALPSPAEIEAVIAHEIAHIRNRDIVLQTPAVMFAAALLDLSRIGGFLERPLLFVLGPVAAAFEHLLLSPKRELAADRLAAEICESPHGLADALIRLEQAVELVEFQASPATEPLFTINPFDETGLAGMFGSHPPIAERVRRLRDLDPSWREDLRAA